MSLDVYLEDPTATYDSDELHWQNITHNLGAMASEAGLYYALWHPDEIGAKYAKDIINTVEAGLDRMKSDPEKYSKHNAENGWGTYEQFVPWIEEYLIALKKYPEAVIRTST